MKIRIKNKRRFIFMLIILFILVIAFFFTLRFGTKNIIKSKAIAKNEYEISINKLNISLDNVISKNPNKPVLGAGMIPIKWNNNYNNWVITSVRDENWYNYSEGKYANIMLSDGYYKSELDYGTNNDQLAENHIGEQLDETLGTVFTWIPKIAYNNDSIEYLNETSILEYNWTTPTCFTTYMKGYYNTEVTGFWVSKTNSNVTNEEENIYGLIKNEKVSRITDIEQLVIDKLNQKNGNINDENSGITSSGNKQTIRRIDLNERELMTPEHKLIGDDIMLKTEYTANMIEYILDKDGNIISHTDFASYKIGNEDKYVFYYVDYQGNIKKYTVVPPSDGKPDVNNFNKNTTFYVTYDDFGNETSYIPIGEKAPSGWYNYNTQKWGNIVCRNNGDELYYVWIPRYMYKLDSQSQIADAILVDIENCYIDEKQERISLNDSDYILPEAFTWNGNQIMGYWVSKYNLSSDSQRRLLVTITTSDNTIRISNIVNKTDTTEGVIYSVYLIKDGTIERGPIEVSDSYVLDNLEYNTEYCVSVIATAGDIQIAGYANQVKINKISEPDLTGFNVNNTFIVTYDDGNETSLIPIGGLLADDALIENGILKQGEIDTNKINQEHIWYNYSEQKWPNIVCRNNGEELYYVYIPRYEYILNSTNQKAEVTLIPKEQTKPDAGFTIPEAFTWNDIPLAGYWVSKYNLSNANQIRLKATITSSGNEIRVSDIINTTSTTGNVIYKAYLLKNGNIIAESSAIQDNYTFTDVEYGDYCVHVIALSGRNQLAGFVQNVRIQKINEPDLTGFNIDNTFIVTYDDNGNEKSYQPLGDVLNDETTIENRILKSGEVDTSKIDGIWYDYSEQKWANIVCRNNSEELYYVWIPRYEYLLVSENQYANAIIIPKEQTTPDVGYKIPDAFTWNDEPISGYWFSKYRLTVETDSRLMATVAGGFDTIRVSNIINNMSTTEGVTYKVYLIKDGKIIKEPVDITDSYTFDGLKYGTYTVHVVALLGDNQIAGYANSIKLQELEEPDLSGFNVDVTYIVTYDNEGNEISNQSLRSVLSDDAVVDDDGQLIFGTVDRNQINGVWYNYAEQKWPNIVCRNNNQTLYYVYIPRYEYILNAGRQRANVILIPRNKTTPDEGYKIPDAFSWTGEPLAGYWFSKYRLSK